MVVPFSALLWTTFAQTKPMKASAPKDKTFALYLFDCFFCTITAAAVVVVTKMKMKTVFIRRHPQKLNFSIIFGVCSMFCRTRIMFCRKEEKKIKNIKTGQQILYVDINSWRHCRKIYIWIYRVAHNFMFSTIYTFSTSNKQYNEAFTRKSF